MKFRSNFLSLFSLLITVILVQGNDNSMSGLPSTDEQCPPWSFYNHTKKQCECYRNPYTDDIVQCTENNGVLLRIGFCMTFREGDGFYVGQCKYFDFSKYNVSDTMNYIRLPGNVSELNAFMCSPLNRRRESDICGQCIDGYGTSVASITSVINECKKCPDSYWLGLVSYLLLELLQVVVTYCVILIFRIKFTSSPLIVLVLYCQMQEVAFLLQSNTVTILEPEIFRIWGLQIAFCGIFNLDFWRHMFPAFCTSPSLKAFKVAYLNYVPFIYLLLLLLFTRLCIKLHSKNFRLVIWLWNKLNGLLIRINVRWDTVIDAFATIFFLSFANLVFTSIWSTNIISPMVIWNAKDSSVVTEYRTYLDPNTNYFGKEHLPFVLISLFITYIIVLPVPILLALYPINCFRSLLFCCPIVSRHMVTINTFLDKFYCCYKDGLDGGRDMRSFVSLYYFVHWLFFILSFMELPVPNGIFVNLSDIMFTVLSILIAVVRPYKRAYMNIADALILANLGLFFHLLDACGWQKTNSSTNHCYFLLGLLNMIIPLAVIIAISYRIFILSKKSSCCQPNIRDIHDEELIQHSSFNLDLDHAHGTPDHLLHSEQQNQESSYGSTKQPFA